MEGNLSKALWLGVSILLFIAVVTLGLSIFGGMKEVSTVATTRIGDLSQTIAEEEFRIYDGKEVKGNDVLSALGTFSGRSGEIIVFVATLGSNSGNPININLTSGAGLDRSNYTQYISRTSGTLKAENKCVILSVSGGELLTSVSKTVMDADRRDCENPNLTSRYINPSGKFISHLVYDDNLKIRGVLFAQKD
ncbi:MAG: hypothetical protein ACOYIF_09050 [Acetivibrionales bacterium]|jgi:hypothetical protein